MTHNLICLAEALGVYRQLWRPEEVAIKTAKDLIPTLENAITELDENFDKYQKYNPENGYGSVSNFLKFCKDYLAACKNYPETVIEVDR
jgi:hypothetical protein